MDHPKVRPLEAFPVTVEGQQMICLQDPIRINESPMVVNGPTYFLLSLMDGTRDILDIQADFARRTGEILFRDKVEGLVAQLDETFLLDNDRYRDHFRATQEAFLSGPSRSCRHAGASYPKDPDELSAMLESLLKQFEEPSLEMGNEPPVGLIAPHIDFARGADVYAAAYGTIRRWVDAIDLYVILGTCHHGLDRGFALTMKDYETPLGVAQTDGAFVERLASRGGSQWFDEEFAHRDEHSIEFQAVWLRHLVPRDQPLRVVPILCGGLAHCMEEGGSPENDED
ncbi:MAG: AmmeMemoRadiSam system protein B, partial [bacterium]